MIDKIQDRAVGRWRSILPGIGIAAKFLTNNHGPCPICNEGTDRWRFDDIGGAGTWFCSKCGAGSGVELVMRFKNIEFVAARTLIEEQLPTSTFEMPKANQGSNNVNRQGQSMWGMAEPLMGRDLASQYLKGRGLFFTKWPNQIRFLQNAPYWHEDKSKTLHPAMIAQYVSPDTTQATYHLTYLDGKGGKADLPIQRKMVRGAIPKGGAVRLGSSAETMGVAEGIETALSASILNDIPVWATLTAGGVVKFEPPKNVRNLIIFGDRDKSFTGQYSAYGLAFRLHAEGLNVEVRLPEDDGDDWNDVLKMEQPAAEELEI